MKKFHIVLTDLNTQKAAMSVEAEDSVTLQSFCTFLDTQTAAAVTSASEILTPQLTGMNVADAGSDVDDKIILTFKTKDLQDVRRFVLCAPETGFDGVWLYSTPQGKRVKADKGQLFADSLSTALGLSSNRALLFTSGIYKHTK